jgi:gamma-glutamyl:cysteine ligase YbdK (ATP-grasp superfamily)
MAENRFLAARDRLEARLVDPEKRQLVPVRTLVNTLGRRCGRTPQRSDAPRSWSTSSGS